jgi:hypothetical protein
MGNGGTTSRARPPEAGRLVRFWGRVAAWWRRGAGIDRAVVHGKREEQTCTAPEVDSWTGQDGAG